MRVAAIMPCRGRAEQTIRNVRRLLATAGDVDWALFCVVDDDHDTAALLMRELHGRVGIHSIAPRRGYWGCLASLELPEATHFVGLANDLLPGQHWLARAVSAYTQVFGDGPGMVGFNDGHHETEHSCHFLIGRNLLERYGGWPLHYDHNFGDTELCQRAIADSVYVKAPYATLFHDHVYFGGTDDEVYQEGRAQAHRDQALYEDRRRRGWPTISR